MDLLPIEYLLKLSSTVSQENHDKFQKVGLWQAMVSGHNNSINIKMNKLEKVNPFKIKFLDQKLTEHWISNYIEIN